MGTVLFFTGLYENSITCWLTQNQTTAPFLKLAAVCPISSSILLMRAIRLVEAPSNLGLKGPAPGVVPAVDWLPAWLRQWGFYDLVAPQYIHTLTPPPYAMQLDPVGIRNADAISRYSQQLAACITPVVRLPGFVLVVGGDYSILLGIALGLKSAGTYGLFFLDGHTDYAEPGRSETGGAAGMVLP